MHIAGQRGEETSASRSIRRVCADCFHAKTAFYHKIIVFVFMDSPCDFRWRSLAPKVKVDLFLAKRSNDSSRHRLWSFEVEAKEGKARNSP